MIDAMRQRVARVTATAAAIAVVGLGPCFTALAVRAAGDPGTTAVVPPRAAKFVLKYRALPGQTEQQFDEVLLTGRTHGRAFTFHNTQVNRMTFTRVDANGNATFEDRVASSTLTLNGRRAPAPPQSAANVFRIHADGRLASYSDGSGEATPTHLTERLFTATTPVFPAQAVGVGDHWSHDYAPNAAVGLPKAHADFAIVRRERSGAADAFAVRMRYAEEGPGPHIKASGVIWVEITSGDAVDTECSLHGVPLEDDAEHGETTLFSGSLSQRRTVGGPLPAAGRSGDGAR
jgi:hypothetical protein